MNIIFTDIDGVLNPKFSRKWSPKCVGVYNKICEDFELQPVITSTWRNRYNISQLQDIFINQGITQKIYDYTPSLSCERGIEISQWLKENDCNKYIVIDDKISDIEKYVSNVIHCKGWIGLTDEHYEDIKKLLK